MKTVVCPLLLSPIIQGLSPIIQFLGEAGERGMLGVRISQRGRRGQ